MFNLQLLIDHIHADTGFATTWAKQSGKTLAEYADLPLVECGYVELNPAGKFGTDDAPSNFQYIEALVQVVETQLVCLPENLHTYQKQVYNSCVGWMPEPTAGNNFSGLMYRTGGAVGLENGRIRWIDRWALDLAAIGSGT